MRITTVGELIERLQEFDEDAEVFLATQPSWPFEYTIRDVAATDDGTVYLAEGTQTQYLPSEARAALDW